MNDLLNLDLQTESTRIVDFIRHTFEQSGKTTAVIALSGGIDSAVSLVLTAKALGSEHVHAYYLPSKTSSPIHLTDAQAVVAQVGLPDANFQIIPLKGILQKTWRLIKKSEPQVKLLAEHPQPQRGPAQPTSGAEARLRLANLAARIRMMLIFDQAKRLDALVVGTENYSESLLGYFTRFGDAASDLEPIHHLYKTQVNQLAAYLNLPASILHKPPSADLWPGQTDAKELGFSYEQADPILSLLSQGNASPEIIAKGYDQTLVDQVVKQVNQSKFKQEVPYYLASVSR